MSSYHDVLRRHQGLSGSFTAASAPTLTSADVAAPFAATAATQAVPKLTEPRSRDEHIEAPSWAGLPHLRTGKSYYLEARRGSELLSRTSLDERKLWVIGRHPAFAQILSLHDSISRQHTALLYHRAKRQWFVADLKSAHGTIVNGERLEPFIPTPLEEGAHLVVGKSSRVYEIKLDVSGQEVVEGERAPKKARTDEGTVVKTEVLAPRAESASAPRVSRVHCSHILVKHAGSRNPTSWRQDGPITRTRQEARDLLADYRRQIVSKEAIFADVASKYSDCSSAKRDGDLGVFEKGKMQKAFEQAAFALQVGELSNLVETDSGVHIILRHK